MKIDILKNPAKFTGKSLCQSLFLSKNDSRTGFFLWILRNFTNTLFTEYLRVTASDYTFIKRKTSAFRAKTLRTNASEIMVLTKKSRYLPRFLKYRKNNSNGLHKFGLHKDVQRNSDAHWAGSHPRVLGPGFHRRVSVSLFRYLSLIIYYYLKGEYFHKISSFN